MHLVSINEAPNDKVDGGMPLYLDDAERETVMITDGRHPKGDENS